MADTKTTTIGAAALLVAAVGGALLIEPAPDKSVAKAPHELATAPEALRTVEGTPSVVVWGMDESTDAYKFALRWDGGTDRAAIPLEACDDVIEVPVEGARDGKVTLCVVRREVYRAMQTPKPAPVKAEPVVKEISR
jgi:hypothetical protein